MHFGHCKKKKSMKRVNIKSTFENLDATSTMVKMHRDSDAWFVGYFVLFLGCLTQHDKRRGVVHPWGETSPQCVIVTY